jgi:hypothetical protein
MCLQEYMNEYTIMESFLEHFSFLSNAQQLFAHNESVKHQKALLQWMYLHEQNESK